MKNNRHHKARLLVLFSNCWCFPICHWRQCTCLLLATPATVMNWVGVDLLANNASAGSLCSLHGLRNMAAHSSGKAASLALLWKRLATNNTPQSKEWGQIECQTAADCCRRCAVNIRAINLSSRGEKLRHGSGYMRNVAAGAATRRYETIRRLAGAAVQELLLVQHFGRRLLAYIYIYIRQPFVWEWHRSDA